MGRLSDIAFDARMKISDILFDLRYDRPLVLVGLIAAVVAAIGIFVLMPLLRADAPAPAPAFTGKDGKAMTAPRNVALAERTSVSQINWGSTWGSANARGKGKLLQTTCAPACETKTVPVAVSAQGLVGCEAGDQYARIVVRAPDGKPRAIANADPTCAP